MAWFDVNIDRIKDPVVRDLVKGLSLFAKGLGNQPQSVQQREINARAFGLNTSREFRHIIFSDLYLANENKYLFLTDTVYKLHTIYATYAHAVGGAVDQRFRIGYVNDQTDSLGNYNPPPVPPGGDSAPFPENIAYFGWADASEPKMLIDFRPDGFPIPKNHWLSIYEHDALAGQFWTFIIVLKRA